MFNGDGVSVWDNENILETDGGDGCTTLRMDLIPLNCALKNHEVRSGAHTCDLSCSEGRDGEGHILRSAQSKSSRDSISTNSWGWWCVPGGAYLSSHLHREA
jgi:hypothetical protein